ncbi:hypothetical protein AHOG_15990 [Actinoalloteichus hoggarensis]|uniref:Tachylectin 2 domain-containing protein n=1 Tax=Actinoalloteichus hoggarensis TaxID=1470176 RepID=A0A221W4Y1_9PSEU|nr:hypothetical protein AHOG_15990 [Actinoalloteichus hoggarensis]
MPSRGSRSRRLRVTSTTWRTATRREAPTVGMSRCGRSGTASTDARTPVPAVSSTRSRATDRSRGTGAANRGGNNGRTAHTRGTFQTTLGGYTSPARRNRITVDSGGDFYYIRGNGQLYRAILDIETLEPRQESIDGDWSRFYLISAAGPGALYARDSDGTLHRHHYDASTGVWTDRETPAADGRQRFTQADSPGGDVLYAVDATGSCTGSVSSRIRTARSSRGPPTPATGCGTASRSAVTPATGRRRADPRTGVRRRAGSGIGPVARRSVRRGRAAPRRLEVGLRLLSDAVVRTGSRLIPREAKHHTDRPRSASPRAGPHRRRRARTGAAVRRVLIPPDVGETSPRPARPPRPWRRPLRTGGPRRRRPRYDAGRTAPPRPAD